MIVPRRLRKLYRLGQRPNVSGFRRLREVESKREGYNCWRIIVGFGSLPLCRLRSATQAWSYWPVL